MEGEEMKGAKKSSSAIPHTSTNDYMTNPSKHVKGVTGGNPKEFDDCFYFEDKSSSHPGEANNHIYDTIIDNRVNVSIETNHYLTPSRGMAKETVA